MGVKPISDMSPHGGGHPTGQGPGSSEDQLHQQSHTMTNHDQANLDKPSVTPKGLGDSLGHSKRMRSFQQILAEEKQYRNILEIKINKMMVENDEGIMGIARNLTIEDISTLIFEVIGINPEDCMGVALSTARYDTKEVKLKPGVDPNKYITKELISYKNHLIDVRSMSGSITRVTFKNVPFNIPDEEIINLCECYGEPINNQVSYEKASSNTRGVSGSVRYVEINMMPGKQFENYYWMEGPLESDRGCRITVLHTGQVQQCSHCLRRADSCPGGGVGKICEKKGTSKGLISDYMKHLKLHHNYTSLKMKYQQEEYPMLSGPRKIEDGFGHMVENDDEEIVQATSEQGNELAQKDARIADLESQLSDQNLLRQQLTEAKARLATKSKSVEIPQHFFEYVEETYEVKTVDESAFEQFVDENCRARKDRDQRKLEMRNKLLDQVRVVERRRRGLSTSSAVSFAWSESSSKVRARSEESDGGGEPKQSRLSLQ